MKMEVIYDQLIQIKARKPINTGDTRYRGQYFQHNFKPGTKVMAIPKGTVVRVPGSKPYTTKHLTVMLIGKHDLWTVGNV